MKKIKEKKVQIKSCLTPFQKYGGLLTIQGFYLSGNESIWALSLVKVYKDETIVKFWWSTDTKEWGEKSDEDVAYRIRAL